MTIHSRMAEGTARVSPSSVGTGRGVPPERLLSAAMRLHVSPPSVERARDLSELLMDAPPRQSAQASLGEVVARSTATKPDGAQALTDDQRLPPSVVRMAVGAPIWPTATRARSALRRVTTKGGKLPSDRGSSPTSWKVSLSSVVSSSR